MPKHLPHSSRSRSKASSVMTAALAFLLGIAAGLGYSFWRAQHVADSQMAGKEFSVAHLERREGFNFINPLIDCGTEFIELSPFKAKLSQTVEDMKRTHDLSHVAVYFRHLN